MTVARHRALIRQGKPCLFPFDDIAVACKIVNNKNSGKGVEKFRA